jgi:hypothetical protein
MHNMANMFDILPNNLSLITLFLYIIQFKSKMQETIELGHFSPNAKLPRNLEKT